MWDEKELRIISINVINNIMNTSNMEGFYKVSSREMEYVQGFLLRGDTRSFNCIFIEGFAPRGRICDEQKFASARFGTSDCTTGASGVSTTVSYNFATIFSKETGHVYMIDARKKLGFPIKKPDRLGDQHNPFSEINFIDGFPGTDVVGFIRPQKSSRRYDLVCNPDYSGDFTYIEYVINNPCAVAPGRKRAAAYSKDFLKGGDDSTCNIM
ncbi:hypothetical protein [Candidatus Sororendozoicomonas aggregata]|uniref:hypothetical protein n=1 Tax=Candidatus Sororendozoicomonas aggregata TaxID=3073239 RepID=UPI002ED3DA3F